MAEQIFKRKYAGCYESEEYKIDKNWTTETWVITRKLDKKRAFRTTLKDAREFLNSVGAIDERNWSL